MHAPDIISRTVLWMLAAGLALPALLAARACLGLEPAQPGPESGRPVSGAKAAAAFAGLFLLILGAKLLLIHAYGSPLPYWDQWDAEGEKLYIPFLGHTLGWPALFAPHNEHRILFTRVLALVLLDLNGQWDGLVQMAANAALHAAVGTGLTAVLWRLSGRRLLWPFLSGAALVFGLPFSWENTLAGFQSQFYFLLAAAVLALALMPLHGPRSSRWWLGLAAAAAGLFTMGSGGLIPAAGLGMALCRSSKSPRAWKDQMPNAIACAAVLGLGLSLLVLVPGHEVLRAHSAAEFLHALANNLAWPAAGRPWLGLAAWLPLALLAGRFLLSGRPEERRDVFVLGLGLWVLLQAAALAFSRGAGGLPPSSRYTDTLAIGLLANWCAGTILAADPALPRRARRAVLLAFACWAVAATAGLSVASLSAVRVGAAARAADQAVQAGNIGAYVRTGDIAVFAGQPALHVGYPAPEALAGWLADPALRSVLPALVRPPLPLAQANPEDPAFRPGGLPPGWPACPTPPAWGSYSERGEAERGVLQGVLQRPASLPYLQFEVADRGGGPSVGLRLARRDGRSEDLAAPPRGSARGWRTAIAPARDAAMVLAEDGSDTAWLAFSEPRELGRLSRWTAWLLDHAATPGLLGLGLLAWAGLAPAGASGPRPLTRRG